MSDTAGVAPNSPAHGLPGAAVAVLGEALVDEFEDGAQVAGGAPFNVARWLAALGVPTLFISRVGKDDAGARCLQASAQRVGLDMSAVQLDGQYPTGRVSVSFTPAGHQFTIGKPAAWDHISAEQAAAAVRTAAPRVVVFGTLAQRHDTSRQAIRQALLASSALRLADLNLRAGTDTPEIAANTLAMADWLKVNEEEWAQLLQWFASPGQGGSADARAQLELIQRFQLQRVVVTRGQHGWITLNQHGVCDASGAAEAVPKLVDTVGAGDSFVAVLVAGLAQGWPLVTTLQQANRLAAAVCGQRGAMPSDDAFITHWRDVLMSTGSHNNPAQRQA